MYDIPRAYCSISAMNYPALGQAGVRVSATPPEASGVQPYVWEADITPYTPEQDWSEWLKHALQMIIAGM